MSLSRRMALAAAVVLISDVILGRLATGILPNREWERELEQRHRIRSEVYHHDLRRLVNSVAHWGGREVTFRTNSLGFRDESTRTVLLKSGSRRLLFIGDSFTEGVGVEYRDSFVGIIDHDLSQCDIEILNAAVVSYSPSIYYRKVRYLLEEVGLEFDELVVFLDISDIEDEAIHYDLGPNEVVVDSELSPVVDTFMPWERARIGRDKPLKRWLKEGSVLLRIADLVKDRLLRGQVPPMDAERGTSSPIGLERSSWTFNEEIYNRYGREGLEGARFAMELLLARLRSQDVGLTVVVYPWPDQIMARDIPSRQVRYWADWTTERGVRFIDLFPLFIRDSDPEQILHRYFIAGDVHFNEDGHRLVAEGFLMARNDLRKGCGSSDRRTKVESDG